LKSILKTVLVGAITVACAGMRSSAQVVFRSSVQYVTVDAVVTDGHDRPISDLTIDDFEILDNGKPQSIADFKFISIPVVPRELNSAVAAEPEPDVESNQAPTPDSRLFAIVIDDLHLLEKDIPRIRVVLNEFLKSISPADEVAVTFVGNSDRSVNFTRNMRSITAAFDNLRVVLGFGLDALATDASGNRSRFAGDFARSTVMTLRNVVKSLAGSSHPRRAILFVSNGESGDIFGAESWPDLMMMTEYQDTFRDAARADVPIYTICPRGAPMAEDAVRGDAITSPGLRAAVRKAMRIMRNNLTVIANTTGGRAIVDASDMPRMINEIVQENGSFYLLGYYPDPFKADGKFHELKVRVKRDGAHIRARTGYSAPTAARATESIDASVNTAIATGVNVSGLPLRAFAQPMRSDGKTLTVAVTVEVTYPPPADGAATVDDDLQLKIIALDADAKIKASIGRTHHFAGPVPASGAITLLVNERLEVPDQPLTLRIALGSQALARTGTVQIALDMPKVSKDLSLGGFAVTAGAPPSAPVMMSDVFEGLIPFQPTTARVFAADDVLQVFGHVYWKDKKVPAVAMTVTTVAGARVATSPAPQVVAQTPNGARQDAIVTATLPMAGLAPGRYYLTIQAAWPSGKPVSRDIVFEVR
jgi:VWFA-related protein